MHQLAMIKSQQFGKMVRLGDFMQKWRYASKGNMPAKVIRQQWRYASNGAMPVMMFPWFGGVFHVSRVPLVLQLSIQICNFSV